LDKLGVEIAHGSVTHFCPGFILMVKVSWLFNKIGDGGPAILKIATNLI
jgi:hypothetical protein